MICEMCGRDVTFCKKVTIEGVLLQVCAECAKFGIEEKKEARTPSAPKPVIAKRLEVREKRSRPKDVLQAVEREELIEDFAKVIRTARERAGMTQKELAMKINERVTIISKIESNQMRPDEKVISKLQKELNIVLKEKVPEVPAAKEGSKAALTLADLIKMKED